MDKGRRQRLARLGFPPGEAAVGPPHPELHVGRCRRRAARRAGSLSSAAPKDGIASLQQVPVYRIAEAANLLGVSDDTMRRLVEVEGLVAHDESGRRVVDGADLAALAQRRAYQVEDPSNVARSARNRLVGLVTSIESDKVMSQVELLCGPARIVSLMSTEAVEELDLKPGDLAIAVIKSTMVTVETPRQKHP